VNIARRQCLALLPEVLIFHLKRFEMNYDTFRREKVNDSFSFPTHLNMLPYTKEGLDNNNSTNDDSYYNYELCGVVVHSVYFFLSSY
jgi:hypothetical protein